MKGMTSTTNSTDTIRDENDKEKLFAQDPSKNIEDHLKIQIDLVIKEDREANKIGKTKDATKEEDKVDSMHRNFLL